MFGRNVQIIKIGSGSEELAEKVANFLELINFIMLYNYWFLKFPLVSDYRIYANFTFLLLSDHTVKLFEPSASSLLF